MRYPAVTHQTGKGEELPLSASLLFGGGVKAKPTIEPEPQSIRQQAAETVQQDAVQEK